MVRAFTPLPTSRIQAGTPFAKPQAIPEILHMQDPALSAMIDFTVHKPLIISQDQPLFDARKRMQYKNNPHICVVVDKDDQLVGFISMQKVLCEKPIQQLESRRLKREELLIKNVMRPIKEIAVLQYDDLKIANIGDIDRTFKVENQHYLIVLANDCVRGVFLASLMNSRLSGVDLVSPAIGPVNTLAELMHIIV